MQARQTITVKNIIITILCCGRRRHPNIILQRRKKRNSVNSDRNLDGIIRTEYGIIRNRLPQPLKNILKSNQCKTFPPIIIPNKISITPHTAPEDFFLKSTSSFLFFLVMSGLKMLMPKEYFDKKNAGEKQQKTK